MSWYDISISAVFIFSDPQKGPMRGKARTGLQTGSWPSEWGAPTQGHMAGWWLTNPWPYDTKSHTLFTAPHSRGEPLSFSVVLTCTAADPQALANW